MGNGVHTIANAWRPPPLPCEGRMSDSPALRVRVDLCRPPARRTPSPYSRRSSSPFQPLPSPLQLGLASLSESGVTKACAPCRSDGFVHAPFKAALPQVSESSL